MRVNERSPLFIATPQQIPAVVVMLAFAAFLSPQASAAQAERSGKQVVEAGCITCHGTGVHGAPKIGDQKAWSKLASRGLASLTQSALKGIRQMPAHGANPSLSDTEIERGITYMVNQSGGHWAEPISRTTPPPRRSGEQIVKDQCIKCHHTGEGGAPRIGDRDAWIPRLKNGLAVLVRSAINGHGGMPARGGMANLNDRELRDAIIFMINTDLVPETTENTRK
jgi:cytochrome c5